MSSTISMRIILFSVLALFVIGSLLIFSISGELFALFTHVAKIALAIGVAYLVSKIDYRIYIKYSKYAMLGILILLILTLLIGVERNGAKRWLDLYFFTIQPSEFAKLILVAHLASLIERKGEKLRSFPLGFLPVLFWILITCLLIILQPNLSTTMIILMTGFTLLFVAGARFKHIFFTIVPALAGGFSIGWFFLSYVKTRIIKYFTEEPFQVIQSKIALGSGGISGIGIGHSKQSEKFLSEPAGDFIFAIWGEEMGLIGTILLVVLYSMIFYFTLRIIKSLPDTFGKLLGFGIAFTIGLSAFINIAVVTGTVPATGITLPFVSFGGSSILALSISIGIIYNMYSLSEKNKPELVLYEQPV